MDELQAEYKALNSEKEEIEAKLDDLREILACILPSLYCSSSEDSYLLKVSLQGTNANVGMEQALVDGEGYPRADIDVYSVRHARHQIICSQNDYKDVMKKIEEKLYQIHDCARKTQTVSSGYTSQQNAATVLTPFLTVNDLAAGGPADQAGLKVGDKIKQFGSVTIANFKNLQDIALVVQHSKDKVVKLVIDRESNEYRLELTPHAWSGRGLLGCNVVEIKE